MGTGEEMMLRLFVVALVLALIVPAMAKGKKSTEWCYENGCISGGGMADRSGWHKCQNGELNVCRKQAVEKPE
jgi:hypothetical protein